MRKLSPLLALLSALLLLSSIPAGAGAERIEFGSISVEMPEGFSVPSASYDKLSEPAKEAWGGKNEKGDLIIFGVVEESPDDQPYYITGGDLIDLINEFLLFAEPKTNKTDVITVGAGQCAALRMEMDDRLLFLIFNRYEALLLGIVADDPSQYEDKLLLSLRIKETPLR